MKVKPYIKDTYTTQNNSFDLDTYKVSEKTTKYFLGSQKPQLKHKFKYSIQVCDRRKESMAIIIVHVVGRSSEVVQIAKNFCGKLKKV